MTSNEVNLYINLKEIFFKSNLINVLKDYSYALYDSDENQVYFNLKENYASNNKYKLRLKNQLIGYVDTNEEHHKIVENTIFFKIKQALNESTLDLSIEESKIFLNDYLNTSNSVDNNLPPNKIVSSFCQRILSYLSNLICCEYSSIYLKDKNNALEEIALLDYIQIQVPSYKSFIENCACMAFNKKEIFNLDDIINSGTKEHESDEIQLKLTNLDGLSGIYPDNLYIVPLINKEECIGTICFANKTNQAYSEKDLSVIRYYSSIIADAIYINSKKEMILKEEETHQELNKYLDENVIDKFSNKKSYEKIGGVEKNIVPLFSVIHNFNKITTLISYKLLVPLLNHYFETMNKVIRKHNGTLDKIIGSTFLVVWNHPNLIKDPEVKAIECALEMQEIVFKYLRPLWHSKGVPNFSVGIGINTGPAIAGNLGSEQFLDYTVIGDTINTAQRLESVAKPYETLVHEKVLKKALGKVKKPGYRYTNLKLKGKVSNTVAYVYKKAA
jgi:class 3 adenylate cyclase